MNVAIDNLNECHVMPAENELMIKTTEARELKNGLSPQ